MHGEAVRRAANVSSYENKYIYNIYNIYIYVVRDTSPSSSVPTGAFFYSSVGRSVQDISTGEMLAINSRQSQKVEIRHCRTCAGRFLA